MTVLAVSNSYGDYRLLWILLFLSPFCFLKGKKWGGESEIFVRPGRTGLYCNAIGRLITFTKNQE